MTYLHKGWKVWRAVVSTLTRVKHRSAEIMHLNKKTKRQIRSVEKDRQKHIRRRMRGL
jgi:hypothetical protein